MSALILAGHGSHISPNTAGQVWAYVDQLRAWNVADEIAAAFWKEQPAFSQVLDTVAAESVTIVPVFTAEGYFTQEVIPAEMGIERGTTVKAGRQIHYTPAVGAHPGLERIVLQRLDEVLSTHQLDPAQVACVIVGHGTGRRRDSQNATLRQVELLAAQQIVAEVLPAFLDDQPDIASIYARASAPVIVVIPLFIASGSHVGHDVPTALGLPAGSTQAIIQGRRVFYAEPVGSSHEAMCALIVDLAHSADARIGRRPGNTVWSGFPRVGAADLIEAVHKRGMLRFGELALRVNEVRPVHGSSTRVIQTPAELRSILRESPFRPLASSADLPGGWHVPLASPEMLPAVVETIYPGTVADWSLNRQGRFQPETLQTVSQRQRGMFRGIDQTSQIDAHVQAICGGCVRHPTWFFGSTAVDVLPCPSPCNVWLSRVAEAVTA